MLARGCFIVLLFSVARSFTCNILEFQVDKPSPHPLRKGSSNHDFFLKKSANLRQIWGENWMEGTYSYWEQLNDYMQKVRAVRTF